MNEQFSERPKSIKIKQSDSDLTIIRKWFNASTLFITLFTLFWCSITLPMFFFILLEGEEGIGFILFMIPFLIVAICLLYYTVANWINRTYIVANENAIIVRHKPIPWQGNTSFRIDKLETLYLKKTVKNSGDNQKIYFELRAKANNGANKKLLKVNQNKEASFIEQTLKDYLNIEDEPIEGELDSKE